MIGERHRPRRRLEGLQATRKGRGWRASDAHAQLQADLLPLLKKKGPEYEESSNDFIEKAIEARARELMAANPAWLEVLRANAALDPTGYYQKLLDEILTTDNEG